MSQTKEVCAFRKRLQKAGYVEVSIKFRHKVNENKYYYVRGIEPLAWAEVGRIISEREMNNMFRRKLTK